MNYSQTRDNSIALILDADLTDADCTIQSAPFASPLKWHLGHTTWFFEHFILGNTDSPFTKIFNSYYNAVSTPFTRASRGMLSRPSLSCILDYRAQTDAKIPLDHPLLALGLAHEEQHQELMVTDFRHAISKIPSDFRPGPPAPEPDWRKAHDQQWLPLRHGKYYVGDDNALFDCNGPHHAIILPSFKIASRPVLHREYAEFIGDGGYHKPLLWLSDGWDWIKSNNITRPLYFSDVADRPDAPVSNLSYYEADAFARWAGARLPTEHEWEVAANIYPFAPITQASSIYARPKPRTRPTFYGDVWEWTSSPFTAYPRFHPKTGVEEYNGKFMANQFVLKGASCATPPNHSNPAYRNFFPPTAQWQFTGLRLAKDA